MGAKMAKEMQSPTPGSCLGWMAQKIMDSGKGVDSIDAAARIGLGSASKEGAVIVEIGPGAGHATKELFQKFSPSRLYGVEISEAFRNRLTDDADLKPFLDSGAFTVHGDDAKGLSFVPDGSVDAVFAFNVVYFLDPLSLYLKEFHRILKPGGSINFGVKDVAKNMDPTIYVNNDWDKCVEEMKKAGFEDAKAEEARMEGPVAYTPLVGTKT